NHYALAHPVCEPPEVLQAWEKVFGDYEIVQPFPQFDRPTFGRFISTNRTIGVRPGFIKGFFQRRGWVDSSSSGGNITSYHKSSRAWINLS
ncbi:DUF4132 domain-containing protein, partial [Candidatus Bathyarchaeota archaeon]|nr:DUF4132 domain-containing protein [Candidatus Bathyarchaeota archaeon]NIR12565.1 DUF4132 domain-containing protein [Desulfobacterales bacterium]NIV67513.1 DUF4132 domain-containing protein [Candidatus Bathyarchaeota archaeon]NIW34144.1 DUF4132 domain-containing protein [Candidatus Bathyarchaeota archaeon]